MMVVDVTHSRAGQGSESSVRVVVVEPAGMRKACLGEVQLTGAVLPSFEADMVSQNKMAYPCGCESAHG